ncbi:putative phage-related endonuclease [Bradyrhizobium ottawaense]
MDSRAFPPSRRAFIGGSDAKIIMGVDEPALLRLWQEKRGEREPQDLANDLVVQLGSVTEPLNRHWYETHSGQKVSEVQRQFFHPLHRWMAATLDGRIEATGAVFEAKFMLPWNFSEELAAEKHMPQLQHNMWVTASRTAVLSVITGGGKWVEMTVGADPLYQHLLLTAEKKFWRCVESAPAVRHRAAESAPASGIARRSGSEERGDQDGESVSRRDDDRRDDCRAQEFCLL